MRNIFLLIMLLFGASEVFAEDALLNLRNPAATSPFTPTLRVDGPADGGINPTVKLPVLICRANAVAPTWTEGAIVPCSVDPATGAIRTTGGGAGATTDVNIIEILGVAPSATNPFPNRLSTGVAFYDARDRNWTLASGTDSVAAVQSGVWDINNISGTISLPTGAATEATLATRASEATLATRLADATFTGRFAAAYLDADSIANQTTTAVHGQTYIFNPGSVSWDRARSPVADGLSIGGMVSSGNLVFNSATWDRARNPSGDGLSSTGLPAAGLSFFNGVTWDRVRGTVADGLLVNLGTNNDVVQATAANFNNRPDTSGATGAAPPVRADFIGGLSSGATGGLLQGITVCDTFVNIDVSTATTTLLVTGVSGRHVRLCSMNIVTTLTNTVALISGTGATCGTGTTGMTGGTTAATGWSFSANGGLTQGSGVGEINRTNATGDSVCVITGVATQLSGRISYTIY